MQTRFSILRLNAVLLLVVAVGTAGNLPLPAPIATSSIGSRDLRRHVNFLASDELGGRYTMSEGNRVAARYLASQLESYGFRGGARNGTFFQKVPIGFRRVAQEASLLDISVRGVKREFRFGDDFISQTADDMNVAGELVFVGYGISSPANNHDDYTGVDVKGKIAVAVSGRPSSLRASIPPPDESELSRTAAAHGAAGLILVAPNAYLISWPQLKTHWVTEKIGLPPRPADSKSSCPTIIAGSSVTKAIAEAMGQDSAFLISPAGRPRPPAAIQASAVIKVKAAVREAPLTQNVVAIFDGADPKLKDEYIVFAAHYDHLLGGAGEVYNGADDDASGTAAVLEVAEAFSVGVRPKRSILIIFHTGEEIGLLGSEFNTDYEPVVPLSKLVTVLNIDMIGRSRPEGSTDLRNRELTDRNSVYVIGSDKLSTELHRLSEQTNADTARLRLDYTMNDDRHPERLYYRSDHYNYARYGVPVIFYFTGLHADYHQTTDDVEKIDFDKMERITRLIFATGWRVANLDHRLVVDKAVGRAAGELIK